MENLEAICDNISMAIDDVDGNLKQNQINVIIAEALDPTTYTRQEFDEMFENIKGWDVFQYADESIEKANWATENGLLDDDDVMILESDDVAEVTFEDLGINVMAENEAY